MAIVEQAITRSFSYNGIRLADPAPSKTPDAVRLFYAPMYPELLTSVVDGPVTKAGVSTYTFVRAAGSKGASHEKALQRIQRNGLPQNGNPLVGATPSQVKESIKCSSIISMVVNSRARSTPMLPPAAAYTLFG